MRRLHDADNPSYQTSEATKRDRPQWFSTFPTLLPFNTAPHGVGFSLLLQNCNVASVTKHKANSCAFWWSQATPVKSHSTPRGVVTHRLRTIVFRRRRVGNSARNLGQHFLWAFISDLPTVKCTLSTENIWQHWLAWQEKAQAQLTNKRNTALWSPWLRQATCTPTLHCSHPCLPTLKNAARL